MMKAKSVLFVSLIAIFAGTSAFADIASTTYVSGEVAIITAALAAKQDARIGAAKVGNADSEDFGKPVIVNDDGTMTVGSIGSVSLANTGYVTGGAVYNALTGKQNALNSSGDGANVVSDGNGNVVTGVSAANGVITVTKGATLGSAAYTASTAYATAAQGGKADSAVQPGDLAAVATSGSYNDLINKPTIPAAQVNSDWNATSGVAQILNKPTLGTAAAANTGDFATATQGTKADSAIQSVQVNGTALTADSNKAVNVTIATGSSNGTVAVNGTNVAVKGLKSAAYTLSTAYATAAQGTTADNTASAVNNASTGLAATYALASAAIPKPSSGCTDCVLHYNGTEYSWEEIGR